MSTGAVNKSKLYSYMTCTIFRKAKLIEAQQESDPNFTKEVEILKRSSYSCHMFVDTRAVGTPSVSYA